MGDRHIYTIDTMYNFPGGSVVKNLPANAGDTGFITGSGRSTEIRNGNPLQYSLSRTKRWLGLAQEEREEGPVVLSDAAISTCCKSMLFHSRAANTLAFLLTSMDLFIYLNHK